MYFKTNTKLHKKYILKREVEEMTLVWQMILWKKGLQVHDYKEERTEWQAICKQEI